MKKTAVRQSKKSTSKTAGRKSQIRKSQPRSNKPTTIADYIQAAPEPAQKKLRAMLKCIRAAAPGAEESLKWGMPAVSYQRILVTFAAFKQHIGFYPTPSAIKAFAQDLTKFKSAAGSVQFRLAEPLPLPLIRKITAFRVRESQQEDKKWRT